ncbi:Retrotransposon gag protein [Gossypium australe]|uniref:Retrotransposon gag protein n=1 Tax=Gossypium australe TaxID=47621 RepID=A0A5B6VM11_9ROSI|nr:Retrotransposon gag protein [Gossypium australe]
MRWVLLLKEFDLWIMDRKGIKNQIVDNLSKIKNNLETGTTEEIKETFAPEQLFRVYIHQTRFKKHLTLWYADYVNYIARGVFPSWEDPYVFQQCEDRLVRRYVVEEDIHDILQGCYTSHCRWHFSRKKGSPEGATIRLLLANYEQGRL